MTWNLSLVPWSAHFTKILDWIDCCFRRSPTGQEGKTVVVGACVVVVVVVGVAVAVVVVVVVAVVDVVDVVVVEVVVGLVVVVVDFVWVVLVVVVVEVDCVGGCASEAFRRPPTRQGGHLPPGEVSPLAGGQNPITLEHKFTLRPLIL